MKSPRQALELLREGNQRFVAEKARLGGGIDADARAELVDGQAPFAVVLGCSDSRVPTEIVFDRGFGDLFVIRVAGNLAGPFEIGSVEFAVGKLGTPLVVVLGHTGCGAVAATLEALGTAGAGRGGDGPSGLTPHLAAIVEHMRPAVEGAGDAVRANVRAVVRRLRQESELVAQLVAEGKLLVVGAEYSLESGAVDFFDGVGDVS